MRRIAPLLCAFPLLVSPALPAQEPGGPGMTITGDQELPAVLYVVPWRAPRPQPQLEPVLDNPTLEPLGPCDGTWEKGARPAECELKADARQAGP
ncbi:hypothetical protein [Motiliproteus sp. SC1-56]|uniref:hypothetical protein n=1 Tax=Motiliproteus sp. SC1-56 TaxID=2799565 RepID=UPI001A8F17B7|nr:hypothetical protein [Motiliproteus sp. SC1-56]